MLGRLRNLRSAGVLGLNKRNADYIMRYNRRHLYPLVDDKLETKRLALDAGIAVPELYGIIESQHDTRNLPDMVGYDRDFVIKPARGSGGDGILVVRGRNERYQGVYRLVDGRMISEDDIEHHISNILSGQYSLAGARDTAMVEYCVQVDPVFAEVCYQGVPDIRVVCLRGYPAMAMVRLPTRRSRGKANLHQGAVGAGIDLASGRSTSAVMDNDRIDQHPDTGAALTGVEIPHWDYLLLLAARCYELTGLGYLGVDIVLDRDHGPLILELNARPGLNIQIANRRGLAACLRRLELAPEETSPEARVEHSRRELAATA